MDAIPLDGSDSPADSPAELRALTDDARRACMALYQQMLVSLPSYLNRDLISMVNTGRATALEFTVTTTGVEVVSVRLVRLDSNGSRQSLAKINVSAL